jgi:hypothetical protein
MERILDGVCKPDHWRLTRVGWMKVNLALWQDKRLLFYCAALLLVVNPVVTELNIIILFLLTDFL